MTGTRVRCKSIYNWLGCINYLALSFLLTFRILSFTFLYLLPPPIPFTITSLYFLYSTTYSFITIIPITLSQSRILSIILTPSVASYTYPIT